MTVGYTKDEIDQFEMDSNNIPYQFQVIRADINALKKEIDRFNAIEQKLDQTNKRLDELLTKLNASNRWKELEI